MKKVQKMTVPLQTISKLIIFEEIKYIRIILKYSNFFSKPLFLGRSSIKSIKINCNPLMVWDFLVQNLENETMENFGIATEEDVGR